jgi:peroxiredoxin Q/BCP
LNEQYKQKNVQILGVSFDTVENNAAFAKKINFPFQLLCDTDREIGMKYGACDSPGAEYEKRITYVITAEGTISKVYPKVSASTHPAELLESL